MEKPVSRVLQNDLKLDPAGLTLTKLFGDASNRVYYRLSLPDGKTFIVMKLPEGAMSASEEITNLKEKPTEIPFVEIDRYLEKKGVPVPHIAAQDRDNGLVIIEDLGDETLFLKLQSVSSAERMAWYEKAIALLVRFQASCLTSDNMIGYRRSFDDTLLNWEFEHFLEYGVTARTGHAIDPEDLKKIRQQTNFITFALTKLPQILVHRDFQSKNLMIHKGALRLLDFQDALIGPLPYDLAALLRDSYIALTRDEVRKLVDYYRESAKKTPLPVMEKELFLKMFDWMTIQRKLKDAGRFVYIDRVKGNPSFLQWIPNSLNYVREAFERQPELKALFTILKKYVPEWS